MAYLEEMPINDVLGGVTGGGVFASLKEASLGLTPNNFCSASVSSMTPPRESRGRAKRSKSTKALITKIKTREEKRPSRKGSRDRWSPKSEDEKGGKGGKTYEGEEEEERG